MPMLAHAACLGGYTRLSPSGPCRDSYHPAAVPAKDWFRGGQAAHRRACRCRQPDRLSRPGAPAGRAGLRLVSCGGQPDLVPGGGRVRASSRYYRLAGWRLVAAGSAFVPIPACQLAPLGWFPQPASRCARPGPARDLSRPRAALSWCQLRRRCPCLWPAGKHLGRPGLAGVTGSCLHGAGSDCREGPAVPRPATRAAIPPGHVPHGGSHEPDLHHRHRPARR